VIFGFADNRFLFVNIRREQLITPLSSQRTAPFLIIRRNIIFIVAHIEYDTCIELTPKTANKLLRLGGELLTTDVLMTRSVQEM